MVACSGAGLSGVFALVGASLGYVLSGGVEWGIRYIAASVLVYTAAFVFQELSAYKRDFFMPCASAAVMALTGFLGSFSAAPGTVPLYAELFLETAVAFGGTYFFREALSNAMRTTETAELLACINTIRDRFGIAILLIEHDMSLVMNVCQRIQVIDYGQTIASGLPEEIAANPRVITAYLGE